MSLLFLLFIYFKYYYSSSSISDGFILHYTTVQKFGVSKIVIFCSASMH